MMTKIVRVENADESDRKVIVEVWQEDIERKDDVPDTLLETIVLDNPGDIQALTVFPGCYLVIKEREDPEGDIKDSKEES
jgi:hypothetical protein